MAERYELIAGCSRKFWEIKVTGSRIYYLLGPDRLTAVDHESAVVGSRRASRAG